MSRVFKRILCVIGLHWSGQSGCGSMHNAKVCDVCGNPHCIGILIHDRERKDKKR